MSVAAAESVASDGDATPGRQKGRRKLIVFAAAAALLLGAGGGGAWMLKKKRDAAAAEAAEAEDGEAAALATSQREVRKTPPAFLPLESFVVNLADRDSERFAQIGITLELDDAQLTEQIKAYMPAIRNGILMVLAHKTSQELLTRAGKQKLAAEIMREAVRPLGIELEDGEDEGPEVKPGEKLAKTPLDQSPVRHVHFSSFIIQ